MKALRHISLCFCLLIFFQNCSQDKIQRLDFEEIVNNRYNKFINERIVECKLEAEQKAESRVDSVIDKLLKKDLIDSISFPEKPVRPERPEDIIE